MTEKTKFTYTKVSLGKTDEDRLKLDSLNQKKFQEMGWLIIAQQEKYKESLKKYAELGIKYDLLLKTYQELNDKVKRKKDKKQNEKTADEKKSKKRKTLDNNTIENNDLQKHRIESQKKLMELGVNIASTKDIMRPFILHYNDSICLVVTGTLAVEKKEGSDEIDIRGFFITKEKLPEDVSGIMLNYWALLATKFATDKYQFNSFENCKQKCGINDLSYNNLYFLDEYKRKISLQNLFSGRPPFVSLTPSQITECSSNASNLTVFKQSHFKDFVFM